MYRYRYRSTNHAQKWMGLPYVAMAASLNASESVGCAWHVRAMSSDEAPYSAKGRAAEVGRQAPADTPSPLTNAQHALCNHLSRVGAEDVDAEDAVRRCVGEDLHEALRVLQPRTRGRRREERRVRRHLPPPPMPACLPASPPLACMARALELAMKGKVPFLYATPAALSSSSVLPTDATSGYV